MLFQKILSKRTEDLESLDEDFMSPIICKVDFFEGQFSSELLAVVDAWVKSLPVAESVFRIIPWLRRNDDRITGLIRGTLPAIVMMAYVGIWLGVIDQNVTSSVRAAAAWILGGAALYSISQQFSALICDLFNRLIMRISLVPVFDITAGDGQKILKYMARSQNSLIGLAVSGILYGAFKACGIYFTTYALRSLFS